MQGGYVLNCKGNNPLHFLVKIHTGPYILQKHNAWQENKFSNVTVLTSEILHSRTLHWDVGFLVFCGIIFISSTNFFVRNSSDTSPHFASVNRPTKPFSGQRLKLSIASSFSLSANNASPEFSDGYTATPSQTPLWIITISDSEPLDHAVSGMHCKQLIRNSKLKPDHNYSDFT